MKNFFTGNPVGAVYDRASFRDSKETRGHRPHLQGKETNGPRPRYRGSIPRKSMLSRRTLLRLGTDGNRDADGVADGNRGRLHEVLRAARHRLHAESSWEARDRDRVHASLQSNPCAATS